MKITHCKAVRLTAKRKALKEATKFYAALLKIEKYDVEITLNFRHGFTDLFKAYAQVYHVDTNHISIELDANLHSNIALRIVAHEMVHVKQYITGQLAEDNEGFQLWKGKYVKDGLKYTDEPWEIEAMKKETLMMYKYIEFRDGTI